MLAFVGLQHSVGDLYLHARRELCADKNTCGDGKESSQACRPSRWPLQCSSLSFCFCATYTCLECLRPRTLLSVQHASNFLPHVWLGQPLATVHSTGTLRATMQLSGVLLLQEPPSPTCSLRFGSERLPNRLFQQPRNEMQFAVSCFQIKSEKLCRC